MASSAMSTFQLCIFILLCTKCPSINCLHTLLLEGLFNFTSGYNRFEPPIPQDGKPIDMQISMLVREISEVQETSSTVTMSLYLREYWTENRLELNQTLFDHAGEPMMTDSSMVERFWLPDIYIWNIKDFKVKKLHRNMESLQIFRNGTVRHSTACEVTFVCPMNFVLYPMDVQDCDVELTSYSLGANVMMFHWKDDPAVKLGKDWDLVPQFEVSLKPNPEPIMRKPGHATYSHLQLNIVLSRRLRPYILQTYVPSALFVAVSWVSFIVSPEVVPGRMVLLVTTLLTLVTMYTSIRANSPRTTSLKAIEVWIITCILFVFSALLEYASILMILFKRKLLPFRKRKTEVPPALKYPTKPRMPTPTLESESIPLPTHPRTDAESPPPTMNGQQRPKKPPPVGHTILTQAFDKISVILFPLSFFIFNVVYWVSFWSYHTEELAKAYNST